MLRKIKKWLKNKKGFEMERLGGWLILLAILVVVMIGIFVLKEKGEGAIEFMKNLLRFKR